MTTTPEVVEIFVALMSTFTRACSSYGIDLHRVLMLDVFQSNPGFWNKTSAIRNALNTNRRAQITRIETLTVGAAAWANNQDSWRGAKCIIVRCAIYPLHTHTQSFHQYSAIRRFFDEETRTNNQINIHSIPLAKEKHFHRRDSCAYERQLPKWDIP